MQNITISGYLSKDAETATTQGGDPVTRWNIPVKQGWGEREQTNWYRVSIWGKRADFAAKARKGELAFVVGELTIGEYQGKPQYEIRAAEFQSTPTAKREDGGRVPDGSRGAPIPQPEDLDDSIPFAHCNGPW